MDAGAKQCAAGKGNAMDMRSGEAVCYGCANSRRSGRDSVFCQLFGIQISGGHEGCLYFRGKDQRNAKDEVRQPENHGLRADV